MLILALVPCSDMEHGHVLLADASNNMCNSDVFIEQPQSGHPCSHNNCTDLCSPLCYCACCSAVCQVSSIVILAKSHPPVFKEKKQFFQPNNINSEYRNPLFRPPKLG